MKRDQRLRIACPVTKKTCFGSKEMADKALKAIWERPKGKYSPTRCYECPECGWWHLTSTWSDADVKNLRPKP